MEIQILKDITAIFALSIVVILAFHRIRMPVIVGFLLTGVLAGPHGLGLIRAVHEVEILAEIGVVLLLFSIGIEFSLKNLLQAKRLIMVGGSLQVLLTILAAAIVFSMLKQPVSSAIFFGFLLSLSSTAIVLKLWQERDETVSPHGRSSLAILIFQDIIIVPMILITPILAGQSGDVFGSLLVLLAKAIGLIILVFLAARWIVPRVLHQVARTRSRELFLMATIVICLAVAWLTSSAGLSLALGAFLAGLIISESEYSHYAFGNVVPFRDLFTSLFFVSIGMLLNVGFFFSQPVLILLIAVGVVLLKGAIAASVIMLLGQSLRTVILAGLALCQVGEFSFVLSLYGLDQGLIAGSLYQIFLSVSVLTMAATPFIVTLAPGLADAAQSWPLPVWLKTGLYPLPEAEIQKRENHLIIVGFGLNGRNVARAARWASIPYVIVELNPETVRNERAGGEPIFYGDATQEAVLEHADIRRARVVVVAVPNPAATERITELARRLNQSAYIIIRTRYLQDVAALYRAGANEVIPEEFETSVEIFTRVLNRYLRPRDEIEKLTAQIRSDGYQMFRNPSVPSSSLADLKGCIPNVEISTLRLDPSSPLVGKSPAETDLRKKCGVTLLALQRGDRVLPNPASDVRFSAHDLLFVLGAPDQIGAMAGLCRHEEADKG